MQTVLERKTRAELIDELYHVPDDGKAEIVDGELVLMSPTGPKHGRIAMKIAFSLAEYEETVGGGYAFGDNVAFLVDLPRRNSFSPDAAWYTGPDSINEMAFLEGAPVFAVEIRSQEDYGSRGERKIAAKIADYFAAGTLVVWDVDSQSDDVVKVYKSGTDRVAAIYRTGDFAEAEPAVPGWRVEVNRLLA